MSNFNKDDERLRPIVEDKPTMRSVSMMSAPAIPLRAAMPSPVKFGSAASKSAPTILHAHGASIQPTTPSSGPRWRVTTPLSKPSFYEFARTNTTVKDVSSVEISKRIDDCFRKASIAATFNDEEAVARADTCDCLKFAVRLWKASDGIVVEVQKTKGCSFIFQQTLKKIFHAATTGTDPPAPRALPSFRPVPPIPQAEWEINASEGIDLVTKSLKQETKTDAHVLAIESLLQLSKSSNCKPFCSKLVFAEDSMVFEALISLIVSSKIGRDSHMDTMKDSVISMRRNAINTLANCLEESKSSGSLSMNLSRFSQLTSPAVLQALLRDVDSAATEPHCAAAACRCLHWLCSDMNARMVVGEVKTSICSAAQCPHEALRVESNKLLQVL